MQLMWELIQANKRKSMFIFICMGIFLIVLGYFIGEAIVPRGGVPGILFACVIWLVMSLISYLQGDSLILMMSHAKPVTHDLYPQLFNIVEEMKIAASLPVMPKIYIIPEEAPNAFAVGRDLVNAKIVVTAGLLQRLNRDELQGVIAHEMSHILNRDVLLLTFAGVLMGSIVMISDVFLRSMFYSSRGSSCRYRSSRSSRGSGGGQAQAVIFLVAIVLAVLSPIIAQLLYFAISRKREYLADASAARLTRYPEGLASALEKISVNYAELPQANKVTAPMYIVNPLKPENPGLASMTSTHPSTWERIQILRNMSGGANYLDYQHAYLGIKKGAVGIMPTSILHDKETIAIRKPLETSTPTKKQSTREVGDIIRAINGFAFINCVCGMKIKVPDNYKEPKINCPKCGLTHTVPLEGLVAAATALNAALGINTAKVEKPEPSTTDKPISSTIQEYTRKTQGNWESFNCKCGHLINLSPAFQGLHVKCNVCGGTINIKR